jgi:hypothetical protein
MPAKNHHEAPFSQETLAKLEIFEDYAQAWIPTFVMQGEAICIFDFFAGLGKDVNGIYGSPIRILEKIREQIKEIFSKKVKVQVFFNLVGVNSPSPWGVILKACNAEQRSASKSSSIPRPLCGGVLH